MASQPAPGLAPELEQRFQAWIATSAAREALSFPEVRRGVQALSARYVEGRGRDGIAAGALAGAGLRVAFASFYAPLHFLVASAVAAALPSAWRDGAERVIDLGAGTGAVGAALALACGARRVLALDRSAWALAEARRTFTSLGVTGRTRRAELPAGSPPARPGDLVCAGWMLNECRPELRARIVTQLARALDAGARVIVLEPLARGAAPWWDELAAALSRRGFASELHKYSIERPDWIERLDQASGLDHREIGARVLWGPHGS
jgi:SAM-dependent methyltransferase